jgi:predicted lipoprotein with Yx(FWY)xxD motif
MSASSLRRLVALTALLVCTSGIAGTSSVPLKSSPFGYFTTLSGDIAFTCDKDVPNSKTRSCHIDPDPQWSPLLAADNDTPGGEFGIAKLDDGKLHWTYRGRPVYIAGDRTERKAPWKRTGHQAIWRQR